MAEETKIGHEFGFGKFTADPDRWRKASPIEGFVYRYLPHHMKFPTPDFHREFYWALEDSKRLMEMSPRGFGKSIRASFFLPLAFAAMERVQKIAILSKTAGLAERFLGMIKTEVETNKILRYDFPRVRRGPKWSNDHAIFASGVEIWAKGWGAQIRGDHPNLIIVDDPEDEESTASEVQLEKTYEVFTRTIMGALDDEPGMQDAKVIVIGTNIHPDCLVNRIYTNYEDRYRDWSVLFFAATHAGQSIWPERRPLEWLEARLREIGPDAFNAEYMNEPILGHNVLLRPEFFRERNAEVDMERFARSIMPRDKVTICAVDIAQSMQDSADSSAWCVGLKNHNTQRKFVLSGDVVKVPVRLLAKMVAVDCERFDVDYCNIEDSLKESTDPERQSIVPTVFREEFIGAGVKTVVRTIKPDKDKYRRGLPVQAMAFRKEIIWPEKPGPGLRKLWDEVVGFPLRAHDDGYDAFVHCMRKLELAGRRHEQSSYLEMKGGSYAVYAD